jgi:hypothetical protein
LSCEPLAPQQAPPMTTPPLPLMTMPLPASVPLISLRMMIWTLSSS